VVPLARNQHREHLETHQGVRFNFCVCVFKCSVNSSFWYCVSCLIDVGVDRLARNQPRQHLETDQGLREFVCVCFQSSV